MKRTIGILFCVASLWSCSRQEAIIVGSKNFTEQVILGEIAAQQLERKLHTRVERRLNLGGTLLAHGALVNGQIDLYPEYTGTASSAVLKQQVVGDSAKAYMEVKDAYRERFPVHEGLAAQTSLLQIPREPAHVYHRSFAIVSAMAIPTAADLASTIPFQSRENSSAEPGRTKNLDMMRCFSFQSPDCN